MFRRVHGSCRRHAQTFGTSFEKCDSVQAHGSSHVLPFFMEADNVTKMTLSDGSLHPRQLLSRGHSLSVGVIEDKVATSDIDTN